jgi:hypothetical protein
MVLSKALDIVLKDVKNSISWGVFYSELVKLLGEGFCGKINFYENIDEDMLDRGFWYNNIENSYFKEEV